jgi:hypothetical protein
LSCPVPPGPLPWKIAIKTRIATRSQNSADYWHHSFL